MLPMLGKHVGVYQKCFCNSMFRHVNKALLFNASVKLLLLSQKSEIFAKKVAPVGPGLLQWYVA